MSEATIATIDGNYYVDEFAGRHNQRKLDTELQMAIMVQLMVGKRLRYKVLAVGKHEGRVRVAE